MNTQGKFLQAARDEAEVRGLTLIEDKQYGNVGTVRFEKADSFVPVLKFGYDFQGGYVRFSGALGDPEQRYGFVGTRSVKYDELDSVLTLLREALGKGRKA